MVGTSMMRTAMRRFACDKRGVAMLEFALVAPVFLGMMMGMVGYGGYFWRAHMLQQVANDGARAALPGLTASERQALALVAITNEFASLASVESTRTTTTVAETASTITVSIQYDGSHDAILNVGLVPVPKTINRIAAVQIAGL